MAQTQDLIALEKKLLEKEEKLEQEKNRLGKQKEKLEEKLEKASSLSREEAKKELFELIEESESTALAKIIRAKEEEAKTTADKKAQEILVESMRHGALDYIAEYTVSVVKIADEDVKGQNNWKRRKKYSSFRTSNRS